MTAEKGSALHKGRADDQLNFGALPRAKSDPRRVLLLPPGQFTGLPKREKGKNCCPSVSLMERTSELPPGLRHLNLKKSFKLGIRSLLTTCSREEFSKAFPRFSNVEQGTLHQLFIQVITSLHENIEDEFESLCPETQVETILDTVEELVEEQTLDSLPSDMSYYVGDLEHNLSTARKNEIEYLKGMLEMAEERKGALKARIEQLKKNKEDVSHIADASEKLSTAMLNYKTCESSGAS